ncbi:MAG: UDP-3-O-[3-hydroxymyristoyl] N-acetylglucosamine deacetylase [Phycisphaerales bacterium]|nr:UDP-3-O-[3-hydroxymyristoyl] N-acetylglucosamine deacetylase [Phycisphaerales bacterium]NNM26285.1 UDP-3-O-[3-hydroxymyristoyl] N-acetylglucosamine deacetylase [Phycisphaerales bacterium]
MEISGRGLLLGEPAEVTMQPAPAGHGIVFERVDVSPPVKVPALATNVAKRARRTTLRIGSVSVETVEHCMSALAGLQVDNLLIQINGPELPCGDGSALPFVEPILEAGLEEQDASRRVYTVTEPLLVEDGDAMLAVFPSDEDEFQLIYDLDYGAKSNRIKRQTQAFTSRNGDYRTEVARARTFSLKEEAQALWDRGMCRHLTPKDVLVIGDDGPIDNEYRFDNEPVRHKVLDLVGDLYLVGCQVHGRFVACRSGHDLNRAMALKIMDQMQTTRRRDAVRGGKVLDVRAIQRIMPHRYPMLLVDRVVEIEGDRRAVGVKSVTINEPFFQGHYPGTPIMPGVLIVEAMAQLGGLLMSQKLEHTGKIAVLLSLDKVKLRCPVTPGDQLILEAESVRARARTGTLKCRAFVASRLAAEAQIRFMMVDAESD